MPPVYKKPMISIFSSTFPAIAISADSPRLRFNQTRDLCSQKVCFFYPKNHTLVNLQEYKKNESACGPREGPDFAISFPLAPYRSS